MASPRTFLLPVRDIAYRARPQALKRKIAPLTQTRFASNDPVKTSQLPPGSKGPNENQLPHVSEEQAAMDKITGGTPPDVDQGTPVQKVNLLKFLPSMILTYFCRYSNAIQMLRRTLPKC